MQYLKPSFTLPTVNKRMTQTEYEIAVGLRNSDGSLRRSKKTVCEYGWPMDKPCMTWKCPEAHNPNLLARKK